MQTDSSSIWTWVAESIYFVGNDYTQNQSCYLYVHINIRGAFNFQTFFVQALKLS